MSTHPGFYRAVVVDNQDPDDAGRVRLRIPQLLGTNNTGWAYPMTYSGVSPEVNDLVWASFEGGDPAFPIYLVFGTIDVSKFASVTGTLPVANGGTNAATAAGARTNLGAAASGANTDITSLSNPTINTALNLGTGTDIVFEGATANAFETTLTVVDPTADRTVTIPNATTTLVGTDTIDTLTGKSISGSTNTLTAIPLSTAVTGTLPVGNGGTGRTSFSNSAVLISNSGGALTTGITGTAQQILKFDATGAPVAGAVTLNNSSAVSTPIQSGTTTITLTAAASGSKAVTFNANFDVGVVPNVVVTASSAVYNCNVSASARTGFTFGVRHVDNTAATVTVTVYWIAMATS